MERRLKRHLKAFVMDTDWEKPRMSLEIVPEL